MNSLHFMPTVSAYGDDLSVQVLWENEREREGLKKKQSFIDLGCGNGLLVYLLTKEGVSKSFCLFKSFTVIQIGVLQLCNMPYCEQTIKAVKLQKIFLKCCTTVNNGIHCLQMMNGVRKTKKCFKNITKTTSHTEYNRIPTDEYSSCLLLHCSSGANRFVLMWGCRSVDML